MLLDKQGIDSASTMTLKAASPIGIICREGFWALPKPVCVCASLSQLTNAGKKDEKARMETAGMHFLIGCQCGFCDCKLLKIEQTMNTIDSSKLGLLREDIGPPPPPLWSHWLTGSSLDLTALPCRGRRCWSRTSAHSSSRNSCNSPPAAPSPEIGWSPHSSLPPHRQTSRSWCPAGCCSPAPRMSAWTRCRSAADGGV